MVISCSAYNCQERQTTVNVLKESNNVKNSISFHRFPTNESRRSQWIRATRRQNWTPSKFAFICSKHFTPEDYLIPPGQPNPRLKRTAVPSSFDFPRHLQATPKPPRREIKRCTNLQSMKKRIKIEQHTDHLYSKTTNDITDIAKSPQKLKLKKKIKILQQKIRRQNKKMSTLNDVITTLTEKKLLKESPANLLKDQFSGLSLDIFQSEIKNSKRKNKGRRYHEEVKKFALTLHFYSPRAYSYLRKIFCLPHPSSIRNWTSSINCEPGFHSDVLQNLSKQLEKNPLMADCCLMIDAMAIRKQVLYDTKNAKFSGFVDYGGIVGECSEDQASEALVFLLVGLNKYWKCPIGYFLTNKLNGDMQASLVRYALSVVADHGFRVWSVTCDGTATNLDTFRTLGCQFIPNFDNIKTFFTHPTRDYNVHVVLDACHMVKLARNTIGDFGVLRNADNQKIEWNYFEKLVKLQDDESLSLGNKLNTNHVVWQQHKMKVNLAVQTLSSSVAQALEFLKEDLQLSDFKDCGPTITYIKNIDRIFDILNSRSPFGNGYKSPMKLSNLAHIEDIFRQTAGYLLSLKAHENQLLVHSRRKTFVLGFLITMRSILSIAKSLLQRDEHPFKYVLSYKFSQDHIELLFACIRGKGGFNNNPNTLQLKYALRNILFKNAIVASQKANVMSFETESAGSLFSLKWTKHRSPITEQLNEDSIDNDVEIENLANALDNVVLSEVSENILYYIAGFIVRKLKRNIDCSICCESLLAQQNDVDHSYVNLSLTHARFLQRKNNGGLVQPSYGVYMIIKYAERAFRLRVKGTESELKISNEQNLIKKMTNDVLKTNGRQIELLFLTLQDHRFDNDLVFEDDHLTQIIKKICEKYLLLRMQTYAKRYTRQVIMNNKPSVRHQMNKTVIFKSI